MGRHRHPALSRRISRRGVTLIELAIVIAIVAILIGISIWGLAGLQKAALYRRTQDELQGLLDGMIAAVARAEKDGKSIFATDFSDMTVTRFNVEFDAVPDNTCRQIMDAALSAIRTDVLGAGAGNGINAFGSPYRVCRRNRVLLVETCVPASVTPSGTATLCQSELPFCDASQACLSAGASLFPSGGVARALRYKVYGGDTVGP
jgi:prepilin-type N-terminal cleavage/methylation domain-containing protein